MSNILLAGLERIELPPSVSKTEMISISPKAEIEFESSAATLSAPFTRLY